MKRPLVVFTLAFCLGIFLADRLRPPFAGVYAAGCGVFLATLLLLSRPRSSTCALLVLACLLGAGWLRASYLYPAGHIRKFPLTRNGSVGVFCGSIASEPAVRRQGRQEFICALHRIRAGQVQRQVSGLVLVSVKSRARFSYGDELAFRGKACRPHPLFLRRGIAYTVNVSRSCDVILQRRGRPSLHGVAIALKNRMSAALSAHLSSLSAGLLEAMLLGDKARTSKSVYNAMIKTGTVHILVVSGSMVALVSFVILLCLKALRICRVLRTLLAIPLLVLYCLLCGASSPVVRATIMGTVYLTAYFFRRDPDVYVSLSLAALCILCYNPRQLFDAGFQLSFASVLAIACLYPRFRARIIPEGASAGPLRFLVESLLVSFAAWLGTAGFIAWHFRLFSPVTVIANVCIVPLACLLSLCGLSLAAASFLAPGMAAWCAPGTEFVTALIIRINASLLSLPAASIAF